MTARARAAPDAPCRSRYMGPSGAGATIKVGGARRAARARLLRAGGAGCCALACRRPSAAGCGGAERTRPLGTPLPRIETHPPVAALLAAPPQLCNNMISAAAVAAVSEGASGCTGGGGLLSVWTVVCARARTADAAA